MVATALGCVEWRVVASQDLAQGDAPDNESIATKKKAFPTEPPASATEWESPFASESGCGLGGEHGELDSELGAGFAVLSGNWIIISGS